MTLETETQLANTRTKLRELQERYEALRNDPSEDPRVRRLTMMSLKSGKTNRVTCCDVRSKFPLSSLPTTILPSLASKMADPWRVGLGGWISS